VFINGDLLREPSQKIVKMFARVLCAHFHGLFISFLIAENHCAAWMFTVTFAYPTQAVGIFKIVALCTVRIKLSGFKQLLNFLHLIQKYFLLIALFVYICIVRAKKIRVKNAWIAIFTQQ